VGVGIIFEPLNQRLCFQVSHCTCMIDFQSHTPDVQCNMHEVLCCLLIQFCFTEVSHIVLHAPSQAIVVILIPNPVLMIDGFSIAIWSWPS
jgi:hypothetical protein